MKKVFVDGSEGTTGLQIHKRLQNRKDIELLHIDSSLRKKTEKRKKLINTADLVFICLPDEAARDAMQLVYNPDTRIIDASSAHRTADGWVYGLPEISETQRDRIKNARRVSNPGCHATGAILLLSPLVTAGIISPDAAIAITSITGYTGGGKSMIADYENTTLQLDAPRLYSASAQHKHIPEIMRYCELSTKPQFLPIVAAYPQGMQVIIPLTLPGKRREVEDTLTNHYARCKNIQVSDERPIFAPSDINANSDKVTLNVQGYDDVIILTAQLDNLGKGASGAAIQNMNIMLGFEEYEGLKI